MTFAIVLPFALLRSEKGGGTMLPHFSLGEASFTAAREPVLMRSAVWWKYPSEQEQGNRDDAGCSRIERHKASGEDLRLCCKNDDEGGDDVKSSSRSVRLPLQTTWQPRQPGLAHLLCSPLAVVLF
jgi:hypothetical protein